MRVAVAVLLTANLAAAVASGQSTAPRPPEPRGLFPSFRITSDYRFQGVRLSDRQPAVQLSLHWLLPEGIYAGVWMSRVDFDDPTDTWLEVDLYAGRRFRIRGNEVRLEAMYNSFNEGDVGRTYDFFQAKVLVDRNLGRIAFGTTTALSPSGSYGAGVTLHTHARAAMDVTSLVAVTGSAGVGFVEHRRNRAYWDVGVTTTLSGLSLDLRYTDTNLRPESG